MMMFEPDEYALVDEELEIGDVFVSASDAVIVVDKHITPNEPDGTVRFFSVWEPDEDDIKKQDVCEFYYDKTETRDWIQVEQDVFSNADVIISEYITHNLNVDVQRLGLSHPHSAANTVADVVAASLVTRIENDWPPDILHE